VRFEEAGGCGMDEGGVGKRMEEWERVNWIMRCPVV
jgi:hypothetical protein